MCVKSINVFNFIVKTEFNFSERENIFEAMSKYCGSQIQGAYYDELKPPNLYTFISELKNVKEVHLKTDQICGDDLIDAIRRLVENEINFKELIM